MSKNYILLNLTDVDLIEKLSQFSIAYITNDKLADDGRETEYHVTLLADVKVGADVPFRLIEGKSFEIELGKITKFDNDEHDVIKIEIKDSSKELFKLHELLKEEVDNEETYPEYAPHITLAYVKKGTCDELINNSEFDGIKTKIELVKFSAEDENETMYKKLSKLGYGGWISPSGEFNEVNYQGHGLWAFRNRKQVGLDDDEMDNFLISEAFLEKGWIRVVIQSNLNFDIYDLNKLPIIDNFIFDNNLLNKNISIDCQYTRKTYSISKEEYEESNFNLKSAISHSRDIRGIKKLSKIYHKDIGFPKEYLDRLYWYTNSLNGLNTNFTRHYLQNEERTKSTDDFLKYVQIKVSNVFEFTTDEQGDIVKIACRIPFQNGNDIIFSVSENNGQRNIITMWFNNKNDVHKTLDKSRYNYAMNKQSNISNNIFQYLKNNYEVDNGDCYGIAFVLYTLFGGQIQGIFRDDEPEYALHMVLLLNGKLYDGNGERTEQDILEYFSGYDNDTEQEHNATIETVPIEFVEEMIGESQTKLNNIKSINELVNDLTSLNKTSIQKTAFTLYHGTHENFKGFDDDFDYENIPDDIGQIRDYEVPYGMVFLSDNFERVKSYGNKVVCYDLISKKLLKINAGNNSPDVFFDNDYNGQNKIMTKFENGNYDAIEISGYTPNSGKTKTYITYPNNLVEKNINKTSKTKLQLIDSTELVIALKLINSLQYHNFRYTIDNGGLLFDDLNDLQEVKKLLDSNNIGNLTKTSHKASMTEKTHVDVDYWDFDERESYSFTMKDENDNELATLQTETYDENKHGIFDIEVNKKYRRKGLATKLFYYVKEYLEQKGIELIHSNQLSADGQSWKQSLSGAYITYNDLSELKEYLIVYLNNRIPGVNVHEIDTIYDYKKLCDWLYKNARKDNKINSIIINSMNKKSMKKIAVSYADGSAWVRTYIDFDDLEDDENVENILQSNIDSDDKESAITDRIKEILNERGYVDYEIQNMTTENIHIDWMEVSKFVRNWESMYKEDIDRRNREKEIYGIKKSNKNMDKTSTMKISTQYLTDLINENNSKYNTQFELGGSYGYYELRTNYRGGQKGNWLLESGSRKDIYEAFVKYRFQERYRTDFNKEGSVNKINKKRTTSMKKISKYEFPNSKNSIIRNLTIWENGSHQEMINNHNYEDDLTSEGIPLEWNYETLPKLYYHYLVEQGGLDEVGEDYSFDGMDIGFIGNGTTMVNMFRYDGQGNLENDAREIETIGSYEEGEPLINNSMNKKLKNIDLDPYGEEEDVDEYDDYHNIDMTPSPEKANEPRKDYYIDKNYKKQSSINKKATDGLSIDDTTKFDTLILTDKYWYNKFITEYPESEEEGRLGEFIYDFELEHEDELREYINKKSKVKVANMFGQEEELDITGIDSILDTDILDLEDEVLPNNPINTEQSKEVIESQLTNQVQELFPNSLTYESIFQVANDTGVIDNMERYDSIGILNNVSINFGLPRISWDEYFPKEDIISEIDLKGKDNSISFADENFDANSVMNEYDNEADDLFVIDRILDERLKHFIDTDKLIDESVDVVRKAMTNLKRKQAYVKKYRLGNMHIKDIDGAGRIINGDISYLIRLKSIKQRDVEKEIEVILPVRARQIELPKEFKYKEQAYPLENYYITDILES